MRGFGEGGDKAEPHSPFDKTTMSSAERADLLSSEHRRESSDTATRAEAHALGSGRSDVPRTFDKLPDGREIIVIGDVEGCKQYNHPQGDNDRDYLQTCGLVSSEDVLNQYGQNVTENDIVEFAAANSLCEVIPNKPLESGGTLDSDISEILTAHHVPAKAKVLTHEELASYVEQGHSAIAAVNAGIIWDDATYFQSGEPNHAVTVTGIARNAENGRQEGVYINDSRGWPEDSGRFIPMDKWQPAWAVVTDKPRDFGP